MNILDEANRIVNERSEEKERAYGSFSEGMKRAASIASGMTGKNITAHDMFQCMVALKFSRQSFNHKTDNLLDAVAYIGAWNNFIEEQEPKQQRNETFKQKLEDEVFPPKAEIQKPDIESTLVDITEILLETNQKMQALTKYVEYLAENIDKTITYSEYIGERVGVFKEEIDELKNKIDAVSVFIRPMGVGDAGPR